MQIDTFEQVKSYYGKVLKSNKDLQTSACCTADSLPAHVKPLLKNIDSEIQEKFYGCGSPIPLALSGQTVLDLGCGTGRDCFLISQLVGENGQVIGIDMTDEQLDVANRHLKGQMEKFGYSKPNTRFVKGYIENLAAAGIKDNSIDLVLSNCVTNLSPDKPRLFSEVFRVLKPGGELYFSDIFSSRRLPKQCAEDPILLGECLGGAMYVEDFRRLMNQLGVADFRMMSKSQVTISNPEVKARLSGADFYSITYRAFKISDLEDRCEDFGQVAYYQGTILGAPDEFRLDDHHLFKTHTPHLVCGNTAAMLSKTRFASHFKILGDQTHHLGLFDCAPVSTLGSAPLGTGACC